MQYIRLAIPRRPNRAVERRFAAAMGVSLVAGIDEAGRGPLAGPVVAACVLFSPGRRVPNGLSDSKQLRPAQRETLLHRILETALCVGVGLATPEEIDALNILGATRLAAGRAFRSMATAPQCLVTDALHLPEVLCPQCALVKGDAIAPSVAAASVVAKVARDRLMLHYHAAFPQYGWDHNAGYPTKEHLEGLRRHGITPHHRRTFRGVAEWCTAQAPPLLPPPEDAALGEYALMMGLLKGSIHEVSSHH